MKPIPRPQPIYSLISSTSASSHTRIHYPHSLISTKDALEASGVRITGIDRLCGIISHALVELGLRVELPQSLYGSDTKSDTKSDTSTSDSRVNNGSKADHELIEFAPGVLMCDRAKLTPLGVTSGKVKEPSWKVDNSVPCSVLCSALCSVLCSVFRHGRSPFCVLLSLSLYVCLSHSLCVCCSHLQLCSPFCVLGYVRALCLAALLYTSCHILWDLHVLCCSYLRFLSLLSRVIGGCECCFTNLHTSIFITDIKHTDALQ